MLPSLKHVATELFQGEALVSGKLCLDLGECSLMVRSNSKELLATLRAYFSHLVTELENADLEVIAIQSENLELAYEFIDWKRATGKSGRKDALFELNNGRLIKKVRTGMIFLQSEPYKIAVGDCLSNDNQVINFINAQYMTWLQHRQWLICHAAGVVYNNKSLAMAGFSGGGKSALMLHLLDHPEINYLTNDRLFIQREENQVNALGIAKLPRINPGTIINNPRLTALLSEEKSQEYASLAMAELWDLEEKYDVDINAVYGENRITHKAPLSAFIILNWRHDSDEILEVNQVEISERSDLLAAVMKSAGSFYQYPDGSFLSDEKSLNPELYIKLLKEVAVYEVKGKVDFVALKEKCLNLLEAS